MPRRAAAGLAAAVASLAPAAPVGAEPREQITATCEASGEATITVSSGAAFWVGDVLHLPLTFRVSQDGQTVFEKGYGNRTGLADTTVCTTEPNELGFAFEVTAVRVPPAQ